MSQLESLDDSFLDTEVAETEVVTEEVETQETEPVEAETAETEDSTTESETDETEQKVEEPEKKDWTFSQAMDEREKRQAAVKKAEELQARLDALEKPQDDISIFDDEPAAKKQIEDRVQAQIYNATLGVQKALAVRDLGEETVAEAALWYEAEGMKSPHAIDRIEASDTKFHTVVDLFNEEQARLNPDAYKAKLKAEILEELKAEHVDTDTPPIKPSLASKRSTGTEQTTVAERFEDMLGD